MNCDIIWNRDDEKLLSVSDFKSTDACNLVKWRPNICLAFENYFVYFKDIQYEKQCCSPFFHHISLISLIFEPLTSNPYVHVWSSNEINRNLNILENIQSHNWLVNIFRLQHRKFMLKFQKEKEFMLEVEEENICLMKEAAMFFENCLTEDKS